MDQEIGGFLSPSFIHAPRSQKKDLASRANVLLVPLVSPCVSLTTGIKW